MTKKILLILIVLASYSFSQSMLYEVKVQKAKYFSKSKPLRELPISLNSERAGWLKEISNKLGLKKYKDGNIGLPNGVDPVLQSSNGTSSVQAVINENWEAQDNIHGYYPPDVQGDVGPNHYMQVVNVTYQIWDKSGNSLVGPNDLGTIWEGFPGPWSTSLNNGDAVVLYDQEADRWLMTQFSLPNQTGPFYELLAISETADPTGAWYRYGFEYADMPDYPHFGIWPDGYYMSANNFKFGFLFSGAGASCFERDKMLVGDPNARLVYINVANVANGNGVGSLLPSDWDGVTPPPAGVPNYFSFFEDDAESGVSDDRLKIFEFHVDWSNPNNSTFTLANTLNTAAFDSEFNGGRDVIPQPGTTVGLDALSDRFMYRLQYRNFGTHQAMVTNHTVDVGSDHAGVRWYELRDTGSGWGIHQQGTYAPDGDNRWVASVALNASGDMAMEFTVSSDTTYPSIRYTGRMANDPLGTLTIPEGTIITGSGAQTGDGHRWGDYSMMSVDPVDDATFWATHEYIETTGGAPWQTRIASISFGGGNISVLADIKVMLEGAYVSSSMMQDSLNAKSLIPLTSPYSEDPRTVTAIPANVVDWILVELRKTSGGSAEVSKSVFLRNDGMVVGDDGTSKISLDVPSDDYFIVVKHRSHLPIMSAAVVTLPNATTYDFTTGSDKYWGTDGAKQLD